MTNENGTPPVKRWSWDRRASLAVLLLIALPVLIWTASRPEKEQEPTPIMVNVVRGIAPISTAFAGLRDGIDSMALMSQQERGAYIERNWPHLQTDLAYYLRNAGKLPRATSVSRITFHYGSLDDVFAESAGGQRHRGYFENQLIALVYTSPEAEPIAVIVECLNGTFSIPGAIEGLEMVGDHTPREQFTIGPREGLTHHVSYAIAVDLAERFELPLYRGKGRSKTNTITPEIARATDTDWTQVTVYVVEGDQFDLAAMTFTPSPRRQ